MKVGKLIQLLLFLVIPLASHASAVVIVNDAVVDKSLSTAEVRNIYLGKKTKWTNSKAIVPAKLRSGTTDKSFLKNYVKKTPTQFRIYWKRAVFTGTRTPIHVFDTEEELRMFVEQTEGAIGYISEHSPKEDDRSFKRLEIN